MTTPAIIFPDVELVVIGYLKTALAAHGYPGMSVVNVRTSATTQVWVRRDGGPVLDVVRESARVGINVFGTSEVAVSALARTVSALMRAAANGSPIVRVTQGAGPVPIAEATGSRRYMTFDVVVRGTELS